jgi:hypothetical protein
MINLLQKLLEPCGIHLCLGEAAQSTQVVWGLLCHNTRPLGGMEQMLQLPKVNGMFDVEHGWA